MISAIFPFKGKNGVAINIKLIPKIPHDQSLKFSFSSVANLNFFVSERPGFLLTCVYVN